MGATKKGRPVHENRFSKRAHAACVYFGIQSLLGLVWWTGMTVWPEFARYFFSEATAQTDINTFALADSIWFVALSGVLSFAIWRRLRISIPISWALFGAIGYAFFCCLGMLVNGGPWLSVILMFGSWMGTLYFVQSISPIPDCFEFSVIQRN